MHCSEIFCSKSCAFHLLIASLLVRYNMVYFSQLLLLVVLGHMQPQVKEYVLHFYSHSFRDLGLLPTYLHKIVPFILVAYQSTPKFSYFK